VLSGEPIVAFGRNLAAKLFDAFGLRLGQFAKALILDQIMLTIEKQ
jgi:hypothetical protein